jgi:hypothetical protein
VITKEYKTLPELKNRLPEMTPKELSDLRDSLSKRYDVQDPIVVWKGKDIIVDGHHRYELCKELGIEPRIVEEEFDTIKDAEVYVLEHFTHSNGRSKSKTQLAEAQVSMEALVEEIRQAAKARQSPGTNQYTERSGLLVDPTTQLGRTTHKLAEKAGTGHSTIESVIKVHEKGVPELRTMMINDEVSAKAAEEFVKNVPKYKQTEIVEEGGAEAVNKKVAEIRKEKEDAKRFDVFNGPVAQKTKEFSDTIDKIQDATGGACLLPNVRELICVDCSWGFDIYLPAPSDAKCPYCCGENIETRKSSWNSREAILNV